MDAFLRRVIAQRELEQEAAIVATPVEALVQHCRVCGKRTPGSETPVCTECGGAKTAARLALADASAAHRRRRLDALLACARIHPNPEVTSMPARLCSKCSKKLHGRIVGDVCMDCREVAPSGDEAPPKTRRSKPDVVKRFKVVAQALGEDPDALIADFAEGWLERIKNSVSQA